MAAAHGREACPGRPCVRMSSGAVASTSRLKRALLCDAEEVAGFGRHWRFPESHEALPAFECRTLLIRTRTRRPRAGTVACEERTAAALLAGVMVGLLPQVSYRPQLVELGLVEFHLERLARDLQVEGGLSGQELPDFPEHGRGHIRVNIRQVILLCGVL